MNRWMRDALLLLIVTSCYSLSQGAPQKVTAAREKDQIAIKIDGKLFTCYKFGAAQKPILLAGQRTGFGQIDHNGNV